MNYTREQAEAVILDWNEFIEAGHELHPEDIRFLNAKFPTIEVGKWYKSARGTLILATGRTIGDDFEGFGFNTYNEWEHCDHWNARLFTPATEQEVLDRLSDHAKNIYKVGDRVMNVWDKEEMEIINEDYFIADNWFYFSGIAVLDLSTGEWAEVVESTPTNPLHDKIEKLERELAELKQLINK
jgi:hypothetical protein